MRLGLHENVVVSNTFTEEWEMLHYFNLAEKYGFMVHTMIVESRHAGDNGHDVPLNTIQKMKDRFDIKL